MVTRVTITLKLPGDIGGKYSDEFLSARLQELEGRSLELPHPDEAGTNFDAEVTSVVITRS